MHVEWRHTLHFGSRLGNIPFISAFEGFQSTFQNITYIVTELGVGQG
jgi:hypothetical protein